MEGKGTWEGSFRCVIEVLLATGKKAGHKCRIGVRLGLFYSPIKQELQLNTDASFLLSLSAVGSYGHGIWVLPKLIISLLFDTCREWYLLGNSGVSIIEMRSYSRDRYLQDVQTRGSGVLAKELLTVHGALRLSLSVPLALALTVMLLRGQTLPGADTASSWPRSTTSWRRSTRRSGRTW